MFKRDEEKTKELLKGLQGEYVGIENLDQYLQQQGLLVDVHIGRIRNKIEISPEMFGLDLDKSEDLRNFFNDYAKAGKLCFIPMGYEKRLQSIESAIRIKKKDMAIGYENRYMPISIYKEYKEYIEEKKKEYFLTRDEVLSQWDILIEQFKRTLESSFDKMNSLNKEELKNSVFKKIPLKEDYERSFYVYTELKAFPVMQNLDFFESSISEEMKESIKKDSIESLYEIMQNILSDGFSVINKILLNYNKTGHLTDKNFKWIQQLKERLQAKNILKNPLIDKIVGQLKEISKLSDTDEKIESMENILANIYGFAKEVEIELNIKDSIFSEAELVSLYYVLT